MRGVGFENKVGDKLQLAYGLSFMGGGNIIISGENLGDDPSKNRVYLRTSQLTDSEIRIPLPPLSSKCPILGSGYGSFTSLRL